jgi:predicted ribosome quality control (RQC) complex YloA/Tae2 family protein
VHAEVHGAASCVVKNKAGQEQELPVDTLAQAGMMTTCRSNAWNAKVREIEENTFIFSKLFFLNVGRCP